MTDEPGLPATDEEKAALMARLVKAILNADTAHGRAGLGAVLRELREADPAAIERLLTGLQMRRVGPGRSTAH